MLRCKVKVFEIHIPNIEVNLTTRTPKGGQKLTLAFADTPPWLPLKSSKFLDSLSSVSRALLCTVQKQTDIGLDVCYGRTQKRRCYTQQEGGRAMPKQPLWKVCPYILNSMMPR